MNNRKLVLENGKVFEGIGFGSLNEKVAEIIYNTAIVGYQEMISDPTYCNQMVCMSYPLIGNYGLTDEDYESKRINISGMIVREYNDMPSNFRYTRTLGEVLEENDVVGISGVDTREIIRIIRDNGSMKALICDIDKPLDECIKILNEYQKPTNAVAEVSSKKVWYSRTPNPIYNVVVIDCGIKLNLIKKLNQAGCNVVVVPYNTSVEEMLKYKPNGFLISNGPGNPYDLNEIIENIRSLVGKKPILGIGLGCELIGIAYNVKVSKMKCGHHGSNYPVKNIKTGKVEITSQNYSYTFDEESIQQSDLVITRVNVITKEIEGISDVNNGVIGIQYEPNTSIDENSEDIIKDFVEKMRKLGGKRHA